MARQGQKYVLLVLIPAIVLSILTPIVHASTVSIYDMTFIADTGSTWSFEGNYKAGWTSGTSYRHKQYVGKACFNVYDVHYGDYFKLRIDHWDDYGYCNYYTRFRWVWVYGNELLTPFGWITFDEMDDWSDEYEIPTLWLDSEYCKPSYAEVEIVFDFWSFLYSQGSNGFESVQYVVT